MKTPAQPPGRRFVFFSLVVALTLLGIGCANSNIVSPGKLESTSVMETPVAAPARMEPSPKRAPTAATSVKIEPTTVSAVPAATPSEADPVTVKATAVATVKTRQWKQFSSTNNGFEFRYPESCKISERDGSLTVGGRIELSIVKSNGLGLDEYVKRLVDDRTKNNGWTVESIERGSIGGQEAKIVDYRFGGQNRFGTATVTIRGEKAYIWGLTAGGFTCDEPGVYAPILESFRFID